jgi:hypothetical protein
MPGFFGLLKIAALLFVFTGCALLPPAESPPPETQRVPSVDKPVSLIPEKTVRPPSGEEALLRTLPPRVSDFLKTLKGLVLAREFEKIEELAEPSHHERYVKKRGMDTISYLSRLFRIGAAYARNESALLPEPNNFDFKNVTALRYTGTRRTQASYIVRGVLTDSRGTGIDFTLEVLGDLQTILLAGD